MPVQTDSSARTRLCHPPSAKTATTHSSKNATLPDTPSVADLNLLMQKLRKKDTDRNCHDSSTDKNTHKIQPLHVLGNTVSGSYGYY